MSAASVKHARSAGKTPRILLVGAGGIGGVVGSLVAGGSAKLDVLTTNGAIAEALRERGFRLRGDDAGRGGKPDAVLSVPPESRDYDWVLLAVQPPQVEQAARAALPALAPHGKLVCFQNGLCEERVARFAGPERVVGGVVAWGASMIEPGVYERTSAGGFSLGVLPGGDASRLPELARVLEVVGPVTITQNLAGVRWSKLAINCAVSTLGTLAGERLGAILRLRFVRRLALEIVSEVVQVARAEGVQLEKVAGTVDLTWLSLSADERMKASVSLATKHTLMLAVGARYRRMRSSMLAALERGREPAVDFLNGEVVERAARHGISVPINARARELVWAVARGERRSRRKLLRELWETTRDGVPA
ncbi:MAG: 2-dehydropantoate 2-reductase [Myxococcales bacterium]|nr:MAG: 2-dehydropantoate 2-reductase [Myxococcales bacterium]